MHSIDEFEKLMTELKSCRLCEDKFSYEPKPIARGKKNVRIMQIGQAPSIHVHNTGIPFHDASGKRLREWYEISEDTFYNEDIFYITSVGHCFPGKGKSGDKKPPKICAKTWLKKEIEIVDNKMYILIGSLAASTLFPNVPFEELVFHDQKINGKPAYVIPHPSPLNIRWFKLYPDFLESRLPYIRNKLHQYIDDIL